jgi:plasmid stability protein
MPCTLPSWDRKGCVTGRYSQLTLKVLAAKHQRSSEEELKASLQEALDTEQITKMNAFREQAAQM